MKTATRVLRDLARRLEQKRPCAAASVTEGLEETVTVLTLDLTGRLQRSLATTTIVSETGGPADAAFYEGSTCQRSWYGCVSRLTWVSLG